MFQNFILLVILAASTQANSDKDKLINALFQDYVKESDPGKINLQVGLAYVCSHQERNAHESHGRVEMKTKMWENYKWQDSRLAWKPEEHGSINNIRVPESMVWTPDLKVYNSHDEMENRDSVNVVILSDGTIIWVPPVTYTTYCKGTKDDSLSCSIKLGSWTYSNKDIELEKGDFDTSGAYVKHCPYVMEEPSVEIISKTYPCCPDEPYSHLDVQFKLKPNE